MGERRATQLFLARSGRAARALLDDLVTTAFPSDCRICEEPLTSAGKAPVCTSCIASLSPQDAQLCTRCGELLDVDGVWFAGQFPSEGLLCRPCRVVPPEFERAVAFAAYKDQVREMVHLLKYERVRSIAGIVSGHLAETMLTLQKDLAQGGVVVAVPLFSSKQRQRGYNQAELLASAAVSALRRSHPQWPLREAHRSLVRIRDTQSQFMLTPNGRRRNLIGAFAVPHPERIAGKDVLLVDDILTSGATARACATVLKRAGAGRVFVVTLSRAQPEMVSTWGAAATTKGFEQTSHRLVRSV